MLPDFVVYYGSSIVLLLSGYMSFKAIESDEKKDDRQWLSFWVLYALLNFAELWTDLILFWIPLYNEIKIAILVFLGPFKGSSMIYNSVVAPFLKKHEAAIDKAAEQAAARAAGIASRNKKE
eukprot:TRINITY_DN168_c0_g1_i7.p1 TRINITY_DN168_c0_g1~~TRINITY_DN168_c0_g1_i7.p1  ORF type:complete len:142 (-),score=73.25 TRINITY_DN168_c0_g1_i7:78-443(-)